MVLWWGLVLLPMAGRAAADAPPDPAGRIELTEGEVHLVDRQQRARTMAVGAPVMEGDSIITGHDGELHLAMADGGVIAVRPDTHMTIVNYRAEGGPSDQSLINLTAGAFRSITGWIGRYNRSQYKIRTPTATIGVRGTDHEPMVILPGGTSNPANGESGTYDKVNIGNTYIETQHGRVEVPAGRAAFSPHSQKRGQLRPRLLDKIPQRYRPSRHEERLERRHEKVQEQIPRIRAERVKSVRERVDKDAREARDRRKNGANKDVDRDDGKGAKKDIKQLGDQRREERVRRAERRDDDTSGRTERKPRAERVERAERDHGRRERSDERGIRGGRD